MAARDSSSEEVDSSSEDSATTTIEDPISVAKARGAYFLMFCLFVDNGNRHYAS